MRKHCLVLFFLTSFFLLTSLSAQSITIMGIGDSITEGGAKFYSYLGPLSDLLHSAGLDFELIGEKQACIGPYKYRHSGYSGKTAEFIEEHVSEIYRNNKADIVLIHSGHNYFSDKYPVKTIVAANKSMIMKISEINPKVQIFVAGVINSGKLPKYSYIDDLNKGIKSMIDDLRYENVFFVDLRDGFDWHIHTVSDKVHPNLLGAHVMACNWFKAITPYFYKK